MEPFSTSITALKEAVQDLWNEIDPYVYIKEIKKIPEKVKEIVK